MGDSQSPLLILYIEPMEITKESIQQVVEEKIAGTSYFITNVAVNPNKHIVVEIDSKEGVSIDYCVELSKYISSVFGEKMDEFELEVASAGISQPFRVLQQYEKFVGKEVEVLTAQGIKLIGLLLDANSENFTVETKKMVKLPEAKRKTEITENIVFNYNEVKYTKYNFRF